MARTDAATAATRRRGQETKARALTDAGWVCIQPGELLLVADDVRTEIERLISSRPAPAP